jgi:dipeptidyl aminopeptidase/acylaminoacyl peptidase
VLDYVNHPDFRSARISPDGTHFAMVVPQADNDLLVVLEVATKQTKATFQTQPNTNIYQYSWANEERIVFSTSVNAGGGDRIALTGDLFALNMDDSLKFILAGPSTGELAAYQVLDTMQNDREHIVVLRWEIKNNSIARSHPSAFLMDIYERPSSGGGRMSSSRISDEVSGPLPWGSLLTDNNAEVRMAYAVNDEGGIDVKVKQGNEWVDVAGFLGSDDDSINTGLGAPLGFNRDNSGIYHLARGPQGTIGVALFDVASNQSTLLYAHDKYDVATGDLISSTDGKDLIGVTVMGTVPEKHYFSEQHSDLGLYRRLDDTMEGYRVDFQNFSDDGRKGIAMVSSPTLPPALFVLDRDAGQFSALFSSMPRLQRSPMTPAEPIALTARDGTPLEGYLTKATGVEGLAPLIVLVHGGPHGIRDNPVFNPEVKLLASRGYSVLQVNFRGSGGYGMSFLKAGYRNWGKAMIDDIVDATEYVVAQGLVDPQRMCVMGASYGGYGAMMAIARYPDRFKCGVGISGVYDLELMRKSDIPFLPGGEAYLDLILGDDEAELKANSPVALAGNIKVPVFLAHGGEDRRVRPANAERFKDALDDAGIQYEWFFVRTAGHGFTRPENREALYTRLFDFLSKNL